MTKLAILGMGKMGQTIKRLAPHYNFEVISEVDSHKELVISNLEYADVAIEFSTPESAYENILTCLNHNTPIVCGTTGWLEKMPEVEKQVLKTEGAFLYASNFSIGMNIAFLLNRQLAQLMTSFPEFAPSIRETHHIHKIDCPSGTAKTLADDLVEILKEFSSWNLKTEVSGTEDASIPIDSYRKGEINGIHEVVFKSGSEEVMIRHEAFDRTVFAQGALMAAKWIKGRTGIFSFADLLHLNTA